MLGEFIKTIFNFPISGSLIGMLFIFLALKFKFIKLEKVKPASDKLMKYLALFFVPYGVGLMEYFNVIQSHWISILTVITASTCLTLVVTGIIFQRLKK